MYTHLVGGNVAHKSLILGQKSACEGGGMVRGAHIADVWVLLESDTSRHQLVEGTREKM